VIYAQQDSLGQKSWASYAADAGLPTPMEVEGCIGDSRRETRIRGGLRFGEQIGIQGTPTVLVNGSRFTGALTPQTLRDVVDSLLSASANK